MKSVFYEVDSLDKRCYEEFGLNEDILMENASGGIRDYICKNFKSNKTILIACGSGNNGADGIALARQLHKDYRVDLYLADKPSSKMAKIQLQRAKNIEINIIKNIENDYDIVVDCIFGSGLSREISDDIDSLLIELNFKIAFKIACDIPTGLYPQKDLQEKKQRSIFRADITITMGALKATLFSDIAKDFTGKIIIANLGVSSKVYEKQTNIFCLEKKDLKLPIREKQNTHKGDFGHSCVITSRNKDSKIGACIIALKSALASGSGLCTLIYDKKLYNDCELMSSVSIPENANAIAIGMGLGDISSKELEGIKKFIFDKKISCILDADMFYKNDILDFLKYENIVLTPHPKEFISLLKITQIADISIDTLSNNRFFYVNEFIKKYPKITLLLKGANTIIANNKQIYIQTLGTPALSKGGMGDVLSGVILSLLSQKYSPIQSAIQGSLIHGLSAKAYKSNNYSLTPLKLIDEIGSLNI